MSFHCPNSADADDYDHHLLPLLLFLLIDRLLIDLCACKLQTKVTLSFALSRGTLICNKQD